MCPCTWSSRNYEEKSRGASEPPVALPLLNPTPGTHEWPLQGYPVLVRGAACLLNRKCLVRAWYVWLGVVLRCNDRRPSFGATAASDLLTVDVPLHKGYSKVRTRTALEGRTVGLYPEA